ncbi:MAG: LPS export ABC transporter periplasmic protein LptC [Burkholderiales bacterium]|nr:LPS export ABC transporter periplasmic protein LptC [Burkholderiales bacterium]
MSLLPDRAARAFPLLLLSLLGGLALLLDRMVELPYFAPSAVQHQPDMTASHFVATGYGPDGKVLYLLTADDMQHYADDSADLQHPNLRRTAPATAPLTVTADTAKLTDRGQKIWFDQNVVMRNEGDGHAAPLTLRTSRMSADTRNGAASSESPADVESQGNHLSATGFDYDHDNALLKLHSRVRITYAKPHP